MNSSKILVILGIRGLPAAHGGFETFAEKLSIFLVARGWRVIVYCQENEGEAIFESEWQGIQLIHIPVKFGGPLGTIIFDFKSNLHSLRYNALYLTLGYNTAIFNIMYRVMSKKNIINMDGIEWKREKWGWIAKVWFWLNEQFGCWLGNQLIADHPRIEDHLARKVNRNKISMIPYGATSVTSGNESILSDYGVEKDNYCIVIARAEPENSIYEIIRAFSGKKRNAKMLVLGNYDIDTNPYHKTIVSSASAEVIFPGAIYDFEKLSALRYFSRFYVHGHKVGGTNPSLVEALGSGNAVIAHDNLFNRWVAGAGAVYFDDVVSLDSLITNLFADDKKVDDLKVESRAEFNARFHWDNILLQYEELLLNWLNT